MRALFVAPALLLAGSSLAAPRPGARDDCTSFPTWTMKDFKCSTSDSVGNTGRASFTLSNSLTGASDDLSCQLVANYRCSFAGTPSDKTVTVEIDVRSGALDVSIDQTVTCAGKTSYVPAQNSSFPIAHRRDVVTKSLMANTLAALPDHFMLLGRTRSTCPAHRPREQGKPIRVHSTRLRS